MGIDVSVHTRYERRSVGVDIWAKEGEWVEGSVFPRVKPRANRTTPPPRI